MENKNHISTNGEKHLNKIYKDPLGASRAYDYLLANGYSDKDINIIMSAATRDKYFKDNKDLNINSLGSKAPEGMGIGGVIGSSIGAISAAIAAIGTVLTLPGGLVIAGPLAASLAGAGAGGALGSLTGALIGANIPGERAAIYEDDIKNGAVLISVKVLDDSKYTELESGLNNFS